MIIFFLFVIAVYFILHIFFMYGIIKSASLDKTINDSNAGVTIIVAAKNEELNISACIRSLINLNYDKNLLDIILVNDCSADLTKEIMLTETTAFANFKVIDSQNELLSNLIGKANALDTGIKLARYDIIFTTDADCIVPEDWVRETLRYYDRNTAMVCGFTLIKFNKNIFSIIQAIDWLYLQSIASGSAGINNILSCIGNNLTYTKNIYELTGGYNNINYSVTEDLALMRRINKEKSVKIKYPLSKSTAVSTGYCGSVSELYHQKKRWFRGGIGINSLGYLLGIELYIMNILLIAGYWILPLNYYLLIILFKTLPEFCLLIPAARILKISKLFIYYPIFSIYFAVYGLLLPFTFLTGNKVKWRGRNF